MKVAHRDSDHLLHELLEASGIAVELLENLVAGLLMHGPELASLDGQKPIPICMIRDGSSIAGASVAVPRLFIVSLIVPALRLNIADLPNLGERSLWTRAARRVLAKPVGVVVMRAEPHQTHAPLC